MKSMVFNGSHIDLQTGTSLHHWFSPFECLLTEYYSSAASDAKLAEQKSKPHQWKFLNTAHQTQSFAMTVGNI